MLAPCTPSLGHAPLRSTAGQVRRVHLTFAWALPGDTRARAASFFYDEPQGSGDEPTALGRELEHFQKSAAAIVDILRGAFPEVGALDDDQTLSYLHSTISTHRHPVRTPETPMCLDAFLADMPFTPGDIPMLGDAFLATCTLTGFPSSTLPGILDALNHLRTEYRWTTRYPTLAKAFVESLVNAGMMAGGGSGDASVTSRLAGLVQPTPWEQPPAPASSRRPGSRHSAAGPPSGRRR